MPVMAVCQPSVPSVPAAELKAAYLLRFAGFVEWPGPPSASLVLAVAGAADVLAALQQMSSSGRQVGTQELVARALQPGDPLDGVHLLYVGGPRSYAEAWADRVQGRPLLLVTDAPEGLPTGSAVNFVRVGDRLRFEVSLDALEHARLKASSRLLGAAVKVLQ